MTFSVPVYSAFNWLIFFSILVYIDTLLLIGWLCQFWSIQLMISWLFPPFSSTLFITGWLFFSRFTFTLLLIALVEFFQFWSTLLLIGCLFSVLAYSASGWLILFTSFVLCSWLVDFFSTPLHSLQAHWLFYLLGCVFFVVNLRFFVLYICIFLYKTTNKIEKKKKTFSRSRQLCWSLVKFFSVHFLINSAPYWLKFFQSWSTRLQTISREECW